MMNQQDQRDNNQEREALKDLPLNNAQAELAKAGSGTHSSSSGLGGGKVSMRDFTV